MMTVSSEQLEVLESLLFPDTSGTALKKAVEAGVNNTILLGVMTASPNEMSLCSAIYHFEKGPDYLGGLGYDVVSDMSSHEHVLGFGNGPFTKELMRRVRCLPTELVFAKLRYPAEVPTQELSMYARILASKLADSNCFDLVGRLLEVQSDPGVKKHLAGCLLENTLVVEDGGTITEVVLNRRIATLLDIEEFASYVGEYSSSPVATSIIANRISESEPELAERLRQNLINSVANMDCYELINLMGLGELDDELSELAERELFKAIAGMSTSDLAEVYQFYADEEVLTAFQTARSLVGWLLDQRSDYGKP